jgi:uncharacterized membrane protein (GlpM family)
MRWLNMLFVLLVNAVPLYGVKYLDWSIGTVLILYWLENLLIAVFTCARIALHRTLTRKRGHWRTGQLGTKVNDRPSTRGLLGEYAVMAFVFTFAHGIFVFAIVFLIGENRPDVANWQFSADQFRVGALQMIAVLSADFVVDALSMRSRSFAWIKAYVGQRMGRVLVLHLAIIFGMWAMIASDSPLAVLYVLIGLKTLWDLAASNASAKADTLPADAPAWALKFADAVAKDKGGAKEMQADWKRSREQMQRAAIEDEQVMPA